MTNSLSDLIDLETWVALKRAAPQVTQMPYESACGVAKALDAFSTEHVPQPDLKGRLYWRASLKEIHAAGELGEQIGFQTMGRVCRLAGLVMWREADGYHAAWSVDQLNIIKKYFGLEYAQ